jgi:hypothetical protein
MGGDVVTKYQAGIVVGVTAVALLLNFFACVSVFSEVRNGSVFWFTVAGNMLMLVVISALVSRLMTGGFFK